MILDEVGRGTSTYDGMALAHAIVCYLVSSIGCRGLFATHYHELSALADEYSVIKNYSTACKPTPQVILFLHKIIQGPALGSFGIEIAKQAGIPLKVVEDARAFLAMRPFDSHIPVLPKISPISSIEPAKILPHEKQCYDFLQRLDVEDLSPRQALDLLFKIKHDFLV